MTTQEPIGLRLTRLALAEGRAARLCECPAHLTGRCRARRMEDCSCHRHVGGDCVGVINLSVCEVCHGPLIPGYVILVCGCVQCEPCAVATILAKPWVKDL